MLRSLFLLVAVVLFSGCARQPFSHPPIVDMRGVDAVQYRVDLTECNQYAEQVSLGQRVGAGAIAGAVIGGAVGAAVGNSNTAQRSAGAGAVIGGARGGADGLRERRFVIRNCLRNRGYAVLN
ncbi:MAG: glycine zipper family protein [Gammaproteobacteria bacterium]|nr:glycine zipper family protein [Gammaproteobacteria bacterium]